MHSAVTTTYCKFWRQLTGCMAWLAKGTNRRKIVAWVRAWLHTSHEIQPLTLSSALPVLWATAHALSANSQCCALWPLHFLLIQSMSTPPPRPRKFHSAVHANLRLLVTLVNKRNTAALILIHKLISENVLGSLGNSKIKGKNKTHTHTNTYMQIWVIYFLPRYLLSHFLPVSQWPEGRFCKHAVTILKSLGKSQPRR